MAFIDRVKHARTDCTHMVHWHVKGNPPGCHSIRDEDMEPCPKCGKVCARLVETYKGVPFYACHTSDGRPAAFFEMVGCGTINGVGPAHTGDLIVCDPDPATRDDRGRLPVWEIVPLSPHRSADALGLAIREAMQQIFGDDFDVDVFEIELGNVNPSVKPYNKQPD